MVKTVTTARCHDCDWQPEGDPDKGAAKHTKDSGHPTATVTVPVRAA